ncbi:MAG: ATP-binding protein [Planctomycetota bacterium]
MTISPVPFDPPSPGDRSSPKRGPSQVARPGASHGNAPVANWAPGDAVAAFERDLLDGLGGELQGARRRGRAARPSLGTQALARRWDRLRCDLQWARLELRQSGGHGTLAAPLQQSRRVDEGWVECAVPGRIVRNSPGTGALHGLEVETLALRIEGALLLVQAHPGAAPDCVPGVTAPAVPDLALLTAITRAGLAALALTAAAEERHELRQLARLGARAGGRLHDLRNQLTLALFRADEVAQGSSQGDDERARRARAALVDDLRRARELAADGIILQRAQQAVDASPDTDARPLRRVPLRALLMEEARALAATSRAAGARVRARCPADLEALGDSTVLGRLVRNLLLNAAESRSGGASITVDAARLGVAKLRLSIEDDGAGMDAEALGGYLEAGRTKRGSGFGTASVREALERIDGAIQVASAPRRGTRITLGSGPHRRRARRPCSSSRQRHLLRGAPARRPTPAPTPSGSTRRRARSRSWTAWRPDGSNCTGRRSARGGASSSVQPRASPSPSCTAVCASRLR